jgi:hypothetical protein
MDRNRTNAPQARELTEAELDFVSGGVSEITITKQMDSTSPSLFRETPMGK